MAGPIHARAALLGATLAVLASHRHIGGSPEGELPLPLQGAFAFRSTWHPWAVAQEGRTIKRLVQHGASSPQPREFLDAAAERP